ncbi:MAG TPA: GFA family protein [Vitreimonas sp.]|nr:GFA family protein [Vitreimonas sp.]
MSEVKTPVATGGCQCGKVRYALYVAPENSHVCHCRMCQRATGGLFAALAGAPRDKFAWTQGEPAFFASSNLAERGYCRDCGTPLSFVYDYPGARFYVTIGSLDDPNAVPIVKQYGLESRLSWVKLCEDVPAEKTGEDPEAAAFFAKMQSHQG